MSEDEAAPDGRTKADDRPLVLDYDLEATPEKLWRAIVEPALADQWLGVAERRVVDADPGRRLTYRWRDEDLAEGAPENLVTFEITANPGGGAHLRVLHRVAQPVPAANDNGPRLTMIMMGGAAWAA